MGKYMKKSKIRGDVAVMEVSPSTIGVRTRAKTLALQRLLKPEVDETSLCYLQLRSRRLEKSPPPSKQPQQQKEKEKEKSCIGEKEKSCRGESQNPETKSSSKARVSSANSGSSGSFRDKNEVENDNGVGIEASFGENSLDFEPGDRATRESTPCSLIRGSDSSEAPGSTTKHTSSTAIYQGVRNDGQSIIPMSHEIEEFFASAEKQQQRLFTEKYNFDIVNDLPLPGRYEWVEVVP